MNVIHFIKAIRKIELLSKIILSRRQEYFLPVLKQNVLPSEIRQAVTANEDEVSSEASTDREAYNPLKEDATRDYLRSLIGHADDSSSKIDRRILKYLMYQKDWTGAAEIAKRKSIKQPKKRLVINEGPLDEPRQPQTQISIAVNQTTQDFFTRNGQDEERRGGGGPVNIITVQSFSGAPKTEKLFKTVLRK